MIYYINGPHNKYVQIDMSLTFILVRDFQANVFITGPSSMPIPHAVARGGWSLVAGLLK